MSTWIVPRRQDLFAAFESDFNRFFDAFYGTKKQLQSSSAFPKMDVYRTDSSMVIQMAVAGYGEEDIDVRLERQEGGDLLTVEGLAPITETKDVDYLVKELRTSAFQRTLRLPSYVLSDTCDAQIKDGLLTVTFDTASEKKVEEKVRQISIKKN